MCIGQNSINYMIWLYQDNNSILYCNSFCTMIYTVMNHRKLMQWSVEDISTEGYLPSPVGVGVKVEVQTE